MMLVAASLPGHCSIPILGIAKPFVMKESTGKEVARVSDGGVHLPCPLWEAVRAASGFAVLAMLAPVTIYQWAMALPLTIVCVPALVLVQPFSMRYRPFRSLLLLGFLLLNAWLLACPPELRAEWLGDAPARLGASFFKWYNDELMSAVPPEMRRFLPTRLVEWVREGQLGDSLASDMLVGLYESARDFRCVGGMLFPIFCFCYWPLLTLLTLVGGVLPAQRVDNEGLTWGQLRLGALFMIASLVAAVVGGVMWRSTSSKGLGDMEW
ncbi:unnamed protein product [Polarella glacialis]|uniref:Uncharacterized protein n=1 Tax=Polarella glacialis TaxID=89957 RepID=A0A813I0X4_POLGL|nr:unnamed protein product [Polarella glacialis]